MIACSKQRTIADGPIDGLIVGTDRLMFAIKYLMKPSVLEDATRTLRQDCKSKRDDDATPSMLA